MTHHRSVQCPARRWSNHQPALDAASRSCWHSWRHWRGTSEAARWALSIMRTCSLLVMMMAATVFAGDTNGFRAYERLNLFAWTPAVRTNVAGQAVKCIGPVLDPGKAAMVTNGISLGDLVTNLGPGWVSPASRAKSIHWDFADGRFLTVSPPKNSAGEDWQASFILSTTNTPSQCHVWWVTNMTYCFTNPAHEK